MWFWSPRHGAKAKRSGKHNKVTSWWNQGNSPTNTESKYCWTEDGKIRSTGCYALASEWSHCRSVVNKHPITLVSVYMPHSGYPDHHIEKTYETILSTIGKEKSMKIIGGDFNAELGPGEGIESSSASHYTLNKANCRGEWLTQWVLNNIFVALNTMYKKVPRKQVTYHTPNKVEKQLDYILTEANTIHLGSDRRCVMAMFEIPKDKGKSRHTKAPKCERESETCEDGNEQKYRDLEQEVKETEPGTSKEPTKKEATDAKAKAKEQKSEAKEDAASAASFASTAAADGKSITEAHAEAFEAAVTSEAQEKTEKDEKIAPSYKKGKRRRITKKNESVKSAKRSKIYQGTQKDEKTREDLGKIKGTKNIPNIKSMRRSNFLSQKSKTKKTKPSRRDKGSPTFLRNFWRLIWRGRRIHWMRHAAEHWRRRKRSWTEQFHKRVLNKWDSGRHWPTEKRKSERQQWNTSWAAQEMQWRYERKIRTIFNELAQQDDFTPKSWRKIRIHVIY